MIELTRNDHHMNGESVPVLEVWANDAMLLALPVEGHKEQIRFKGANQAEVVEMRLCEQEHVILKPGVLYFFTVDKDCENCVNLERIGTNHGRQ